MENSSLTAFQKFSTTLYVAVIFFNLQGLASFGNTGLITFGLWVISAILAFGQELKEFASSRRFRCLLVFMLFYFLSSSLSDSIQTAVNSSVAFLCVMSPIVMYDILKDKGRRLKLFLVIFTVALWGVNIFHSYSFMEIIGADNLRGFNDFEDDPRFYIIGIVFNMIYAFSILVPGLIEIFRKYRGKRGSKLWLKIVLVGISVVCVIYLIRAQFMISMILAVVGAGTAFFYKGKKSIVTVAIVLAAGAFLFVEIYPQWRQAMDINKYRDTIFRLDEIYATLTGNSHEAEDMNYRQDLSSQSWETFFKNPLFGVNHKLVSNKHVIDQGVGNHAAWPDFLARYGLFAIFLFIFLWDSLKLQRHRTGAYFPTFIFLLLGLLNPLWYFPQLYGTFMMLPMMNDLVLDANENSNSM